MARFKRKRLFVDPHVQGAVLARVFMYWVSCVAFGIFGLALVQTFLDPNHLFVQRIGYVCREHWPILAMLAALLPFVLYDTLRVTHRFAGPIYRLRSDLESLTRGETVKSIRFRDGDHWQDLADQINGLLERLDAAECSPTEQSATEATGCGDTKSRRKVETLR